MDTAFTIPASDFYNQNNVINFKYQRYKASKVDIHYAYCFLLMTEATTKALKAP